MIKVVHYGILFEHVHKAVILAQHIKGLFKPFLTLISGISEGYIRHLSYLVHIFGINKACLRNTPHFSGISQKSIKHILSKSSFEHLSGKPRHVLGITQILKCLFIDTEIFPAYAGSCLLILPWKNENLE